MSNKLYKPKNQNISLLVNNIRQYMATSKGKTLLCGIGITCLFANSLVLYISFLWAYFSNDYVFSARINDFGEAHLEFILLPITIILGLYAIISLAKLLPRSLED